MYGLQQTSPATPPRQRAVRAAHRFRQNVKLYIFAPTLWELETQLLGCLSLWHAFQLYIYTYIYIHIPVLSNQ